LVLAIGHAWRDITNEPDAWGFLDAKETTTTAQAP
jgi:hypothetical protein